MLVDAIRAKYLSNAIILFDVVFSIEAEEHLSLHL